MQQVEKAPNLVLRNKILEQEIRILTRELEELKFKLQSIDSSKLTHVFPPYWGLTVKECDILLELSKVETLTKSAFMEIFYFSKNLFVDAKIYDVFISKLRRKMRDAQLPVNITTNWGLGYSLTKESKIFLSQFETKIFNYVERADVFDRQPWHGVDDKEYMPHEVAISKLQVICKGTNLSQEHYAIAYARLRGFIRDQSNTLLGPIGDSY